MYKVLTWLVTFVVYSQSVSYQGLIEKKWENFKLEHHKTYDSETEEQYRRNVYMKNLHKINEHNKLYLMGLTSYEMGMNHFGDLPDDEFMKIYDMKDSDFNQDTEENLPQSKNGFFIYDSYSNVNMTELQQNIDWRAKGAVTAVKDQGHCGSCWSFGATGVLEGQWFRKTKRLISLSEKNLMDCSWNYNNHGCNGGLASRALKYIKNNGGIDTEASYPYNATESDKCNYKSSNKGATVKNVILVPKSEEELQVRVSLVGPMAVSIALSKKFRFYSKGVFDDPKCGFRLGHAVLVVGYGSQKKHDYWLVKNSWGKKWGDKGYIRMSRNKKNQCGIARRVTYPLV